MIFVTFRVDYSDCNKSILGICRLVSCPGIVAIQRLQPCVLKLVHNPVSSGPPGSKQGGRDAGRDHCTIRTPPMAISLTSTCVRHDVVQLAGVPLVSILWCPTGWCPFSTTCTVSRLQCPLLPQQLSPHSTSHPPPPTSPSHLELPFNTPPPPSPTI